MNFKALVRPLVPDSFRELYRRFYGRENIDQFKFEVTSPAQVKTDILEKYGHDSDLLNLYVTHEGTVVHKWHHYIPLYDRYFAPFRGRKPGFLEIGVSQGGSLALWRKYFGADAVIFGIDINPACAQYNGLAGQVRIGSQTDKAFLASVADEMGGIDIVLDDGSHQMEHVPLTLEYLFPRLNDGGIYMIEDSHTAYWKTFGGGYRTRTNFFGYLMDLTDDMHHWYHTKGIKRPAVQSCSGIHIHDSIAVLEKNQVYAPTHSRIGG